MPYEDDENGSGYLPARTGTIARDEFGAHQVATIAETASMAVAAQARAAIEARYIMALKRPRDPDAVRVKLMKECTRPSFAAVARYRKPIGAGIEGPSIRFAEAAIRCMTNIFPEVSTVFDDERKRIVRVAVTDLEVNVTYTRDVTVNKVVERSKVKDGQRVLDERLNAQGKKVFLVEATEDDLLNKEGALVSKALRTLALRIIPGDLIDECMTEVKKTLHDRAAKDPDAERKALVDAFASLKVFPDDLLGYLGHGLDKLVPAEVVELRAIYASIRDGEATWADVLEQKTGKQGGPASPGIAAAEGAPAPAPKPDLDAKVREKAKQALKPKKEAAPAEAQAPAPAPVVTPAPPADEAREPAASPATLERLCAAVARAHGKDADPAQVAAHILSDPAVTEIQQLTEAEALQVVGLVERMKAQ